MCVCAHTHHRPFPPTIPSLYFQRMRAYLEEKRPSSLPLLAQWFYGRGKSLDLLVFLQHFCIYLEDKNALSAEYVLRPINTVLGDDWRKDKSGEWWSIFETIQSDLRDAALHVLERDTAHEFVRSVTEEEIYRGVLRHPHDVIKRRCFWFKRGMSPSVYSSLPLFLMTSSHSFSFFSLTFQTHLAEFTDLADHLSDSAASLYTDMQGGSVDEDAAKQREALLKEMSKSVPPSNIQIYPLKWSPSSPGKRDGGVSPHNDPSHLSYLRTFCESYASCIAKSVAESPLLPMRYPLTDLETCVLDQMDHARKSAETASFSKEFLANVLTFFEGFGKEEEREGEREGDKEGERETGDGEVNELNVKDVKSENSDDRRAHPLFLVGPSGCGKTTLSAHLVCHIKKSFPKSVIVSRFLGLSSSPLSLQPLLLSLVIQIEIAYSAPHRTGVEDMDTNLLVDYFKTLVTTLPSRDRPLLLLIDSLDRMIDQRSFSLWWVPFSLSLSLALSLSSVRIVLSAASDLGHGCFEKIQKDFIDSKGLCDVVWVRPLEESDAIQYVNQTLAKVGRQLTSNQISIIISRFIDHSGGNYSPLYLSTASQIARSWTSIQDADRELPATLRDLIHFYFERVERAHGALLVRRLLGLLTCARNGLTERELLEGSGADLIMRERV